MTTKIPLITIGLDLGDKKHALCVLNQDGEIIDERTITNHRESLRRLSQKYPGARIAFEVGSHSPWIKRFLSDLGHEVFLANPRKVRAIYTSDRKSDKNDARMLAKIARMDPQLLHPVEHGTEGAQRDECANKIAASHPFPATRNIESNHAPGTEQHPVPNKCEWKPDSLFHWNPHGAAAPHPAERTHARPR